MIEKKVIAQYVEQFLNEQSTDVICCFYYEKKYRITAKDKSIEYNVFEFEMKSNEELLQFFNSKTFMFEEDAVSTIFFLLSGYWEYKNPGYVDELGRYLGEKSFSGQAGILTIPVVDKIVNNIFEMLCIEKKIFFNSPKFCITHDIDFLKRPQLRAIARDFIRTRNFAQGFKRIRNCLFNKNPYSLEKLLEEELNLGLKPICFILNSIQKKETAGGYRLSDHEAECKIIKDKSVQGVEFGLHYSTDYLETENVGDYNEIEHITNKRADFGRAHYLIFDLGNSFEIMENCGIKFDFSSGYRDCIGFRFGTSLPFHPFNFNTGTAYRLWTVPLVLMDGTWVSIERDLQDDKKKKRVLESLLEGIRETNGMFTILWHNTSIEYDIWEKYEKWYWDLVKKLKKENFEMVNIADMFRQGE